MPKILWHEICWTYTLKNLENLFGIPIAIREKGRYIDYMSNEMRDEVRNEMMEVYRAKAFEIKAIKLKWYRKEQCERWIKHFEKNDEKFPKFLFRVWCGGKAW